MKPDDILVVQCLIILSLTIIGGGLFGALLLSRFFANSLQNRIQQDIDKQQKHFKTSAGIDNFLSEITRE